jgi:serine/threonine protein kinase
MPSDEKNRPFAQSGLADAVRSALGKESGSLPALDSHVGRGGTIHLGAEYLAYARATLSPMALKKELEARLAPVVLRSAGPEPGKPFGKFQVKALLGKGGMAAVFLAEDPERDPQKGQDVALKVMRDDISDEPTYIKRFLREAANAGLIEDSHVVAIYEVGAVTGRVYFTMELVQGQTLKDRLAIGPLTETEGLEVLRQIASGLVSTHARGIGHRDLKPSNIMLADPNQKYGFALEDEKIRVKIMDFGLARMYAEDDEPEVDAEGKILGTAKYVAPELVEGRPATLLADVFSLGVMAFQIFSGRAPWKAKNKIEYLEANLRSEAPQLSAVAGVSAETSQFVGAMLEKDPEDRPDMKALLRDTERLIERGALRGTEPFTVADDDTSVFYTKKKKLGGRSAARIPAPSRAAVPAVAILAAVVLALIVVAVLLSGGPKPPPEEPPAPHVPPVPKAPDKPPEKTPPKNEDELALGKKPKPLTALLQGVSDPVARAEVQRKLDAADQAWVDRDPEFARDRWQEAVLLAGRAPALLERVERAERELALKRAGQAESEGKTLDAIEALNAAEAHGAPQASIEPLRSRLKVRAADERTAKDALDEADACNAKGDFDAALARLGEAEAAFGRLGREPERQAKLKETEDARKKRGETARLEKLLDDAKRFLDTGELEPARLSLESARAIAPSDARIAALSRRLTRLKNTPKGSVCVEVDPRRSLYVRKDAVSNKEYKEWLDSPKGKRHGNPWITGDFPAGEADKPVRGVKPEDARAFAESRGERLPKKDELDAISKNVAGVAPGENAPDAKGVLPGFRTVLDAPEERP